MSVIKSFFIAFSIYSKIPVPQFAWKEEDMRYTLCFFPWVGAVIGLCFLLWNRFAGVYGIPSTARAAVGSGSAACNIRRISCGRVYGHHGRAAFLPRQGAQTGDFKKIPTSARLP